MMLEKAYMLLMIIEKATLVGQEYAWLVSAAREELANMKKQKETPIAPATPPVSRSRAPINPPGAPQETPTDPQVERRI